MYFKSQLVTFSLFLLASSQALSAPMNLECVLRGSCINSQNVMAHLEKLQDIAKAHGDNRAAGTTGHEFSANYVAQKLLAAGFKVQLEPFSFMKFTKLSASLSEGSLSYEENKDFQLMNYSGSGNVSSVLVPVDLSLGAGNSSSSGCEMYDFEGFPQGSIALIQRGTCAFQQKVENAQSAGASGVIMFNQGNTSDRETIFSGTLSEGSAVKIPVVATSYPFAVSLLEKPEAVLSLSAETLVERKVSHNVIAETKEGNPDNVVMVGAHLDSVPEGPGINDNGSGSAAILEVALSMKDAKVTNKVRFAWFSAEELGLVGSTRYVEALTEAEKAKIALYINVDMVGSPNYKMSVFDGDGSRFGQKGPEGSAAIEKAFHAFYEKLGVQSVETELNGRSDYAAFSAAGIAVGGIFTGAEGVKTEEEEALFGGKAGEAYDACYHKACDSIDNINQDAISMNTNAIAYLMLGFGNSTEVIRSKEKMASSRFRNRVVFPKHLHCHEDVYDR